MVLISYNKEYSLVTWIGRYVNGITNKHDERMNYGSSCGEQELSTLDIYNSFFTAAAIVQSSD